MLPRNVWCNFTFVKQQAGQVVHVALALPAVHTKVPARRSSSPLAFIKTKLLVKKTKENAYDYVLWGGDFNNQSMMSYNMQLVINKGGFHLPIISTSTHFLFMM